MYFIFMLKVGVVLFTLSHLLIKPHVINPEKVMLQIKALEILLNSLIILKEH